MCTSHPLDRKEQAIQHLLRLTDYQKLFVGRNVKDGM